MKKFLSVAALATLLGLGVYSEKNADLTLPNHKDEEKTYIVQLAGSLDQNKEALAKNRGKVLSNLAYHLPKDSYTITNTYDTLLNGFAIRTSSANEAVLKSLTGVVSVDESHTYARPEADTPAVGSTDKTNAVSDEIKALKLRNYSKNTMRATDQDILDASKKASKGGEGITIGIVDTGLYLNQVDGTAQRTAAQTEVQSHNYSLNAAAFKDLDSDINVSLTSDTIRASLNHSFASINRKVVYAYDYVGSDSDVDPTDRGSNHGTHVASLAAANGDEFQGIAPNAQLAIFKVFGDTEAGGAMDKDITAALEDAVKMKLDVVNLSLGTDLTDYNDTVSDSTYQVIQRAQAAGVIVNYAAGNNGKSSFSGIYNDYSAGTSEPGSLGSSANYDEVANIVASSNPDQAFYDTIMLVEATGAAKQTAVSFDDQVINREKSTIRVDRELKLADTLLVDENKNPVNEKTFEYVYVPGLGSQSDFAKVDVKGKIAVINRGDISFWEKVQAATSAGAIAVIIVNNVPGTTFNFSFDWNSHSPMIPAVLVFQSMGSAFGSATDMTQGKITLARNTVQNAPDGNMVSSFSTDGPGYNLDIDPTIAAPGGTVMGAVSAKMPGVAYSTGSTTVTATTSGLTGYEYEQGTSMASPNFTGAIALALGQEKEDLDDAAFLAEKKEISMKAMSTADQLVDTTTSANIASPRMQGAGRINVRRLVTADSYLSYKNQDLGGFSNTDEAKAELKNLGSLHVDGADFSKDKASYIEFNYTIHNDSDQERTYKPSLSLMIPQLRVIATKIEYDKEDATSKKDQLIKALDVPTQTVNDDIVEIPEDHQLKENVTVAANSTATGSVKVRIDDIPFVKQWRTDGSTASYDFRGTLKEYFAKYFKDGGGSFVEGYLTLTDASTESDDDVRLTMPYLGFYGDYTKGDAAEDFDFEKSSTRVYNSDITDNYLQNLNPESPARRSNAYTGSTLSTTGSALAGSELARIGNLQSSARYGSSADYHSIAHLENGKYHLYAGAEDISDHIISVLFVNRSMSSARWSIKQGNTVVGSGSFGDLYNYGTWTVNEGVGLVKSWMTVSSDNGGTYQMHHGYADIDISDANKYKEGDYTLEFEYTMMAGGKQTKSYDLTIDRTAPTFDSAMRENIPENGITYDVLNVRAKGGVTGYDNALQTIDMTQQPVAGREDVYNADFTVTDAWKKSGFAYVAISDNAHNELNLIINIDDTSFVVGYSKFTNSSREKPGDYKFEINLINSKNGYQYESYIVNASNGANATINNGYDIYVNLGTGKNHDDISILDEDQKEKTFDYNAETGIARFHMSPKEAGFTLNVRPVSGGGNNSSKGSSTKPDNNKKGGCRGSIATVSTVLGAVALAGLGFGLKKRKEDKAN